MQFCKEFGKPFTGIAPSMMEQMMAYNWPGNIRELENVLEQCIILHDGQSQISLKRSLNVNEKPTDQATIQNLLDVKNVQNETEKKYLISVLKKTKGKIRGEDGAAAILHIKPTTLASKIAKLKIKRDEYLNESKTQ